MKENSIENINTLEFISFPQLKFTFYNGDIYYFSESNGNGFKPFHYYKIGQDQIQLAFDNKGLSAELKMNIEDPIQSIKSQSPVCLKIIDGQLHITRLINNKVSKPHCTNIDRIESLFLKVIDGNHLQVIKNPKIESVLMPIIPNIITES